MNLLILRCGDSTLTYRLMQRAQGTAAVVGEVRGIGRSAEHEYTYPRGRGEGFTEAPGHGAAVACMAALLGEVEVEIGEPVTVDAIAHLFPTGGSTPVPITRVDDGLVAMLSRAGGAPGNRGPLEALTACRERFGEAQQLIVWDDAFFSDLPPESRGYLLPESLDLPFGLHRRGYRGLLHAAAIARLGRLLSTAGAARRSGARASHPAPATARLVVCFFDHYAGVTAVLGNAPVWTTFGTAPGDGLPGARGVGTIPIGALETILRHANLPLDRLLAVLRNGGGLGARTPEDLERLALEALRGVEPSRTAFATFVREIVGAVGAAGTILGGIDVLAFVGERAVASHRFRAAVCAGLGAWGVEPPAEVAVPAFEAVPLGGGGDRPLVCAVSVNEDELVARHVTRLLWPDTLGSGASDPPPRPADP